MKLFKVGCALKTSQMVLIRVTSLIGTPFKFTDLSHLGGVVDEAITRHSANKMNSAPLLFSFV